MLQIDHIYEFLYQEIFKDFIFCYLTNGVVQEDNIDISDITIFTHDHNAPYKILFYDQEPFVPQLSKPYMDMFDKPYLDLDSNLSMPGVLVTSEHSADLPSKFHSLYYFFHGYAALDWYRGYYALNYTKSAVKSYRKDFISFNRIIGNDRSYRIYFVSLLKEYGLLDQGLVSFGVTDNSSTQWQDETVNPNSKLSNQAKQHVETHLVNICKLVIDNSEIQGSASANILRTIDRLDDYNDRLDVDAFWHVVTETVFYYDKLHLTEKIFKPIVSKQPFMLLAAPGNLAYLRSYGFKTFDGIIDESYDQIQDPDARIEAVVKQLAWYCQLSDQDKMAVIIAINDIVEYNFHHFYGEFRHIITQELLANTKTVFKEIGYNDQAIAYDNIYKVLTN